MDKKDDEMVKYKDMVELLGLYYTNLIINRIPDDLSQKLVFDLHCKLLALYYNLK